MTKKGKLQILKDQSFDINIQDVTIDEYIQAEVLKYGVNVSVFRISPAFKDGLTPVKRRILYAFYKEGATYNSSRKKASELLGKVSSYHPHGNLSIEKTFINEIKEYETNAVLFDTHGNTGSATGLKAAAVRYLDTKLSRFATMCFFHPDDYYEDLLDMTETYTRDKMEPVTLPSRYPYLLLNNTTGIGWGNSFSVVPFNLTEVFKLTQALIHNPNMENVYLYPDSPRGYDIIESDDIIDICNNGLGTLKIQARIEYGEITSTNKKGETKVEKRYLSVMGLPEQTLMDSITQKISAMIINKTISGIETWEDKCYLREDGSEHIEFWLVLTPDADVNVIKEILYKKTQLRHFLTLNLNFAARTSMMHLGIKDSLLMWISNRITYKSKVIAKKSYNLKERIHVLEGIIDILSPKNVDTTINIIKNAEDTDDANRKLVAKYGITSYQASSVSNIRLNDLTRKAKTDFTEELEKTKLELKRNTEINTVENIKEIICEELEEGIKLFGRPRACRVISQDVLKPVEVKYNIAVTKKYIKKLSSTTVSVGSLGSDDEVVGFFTNVAESNNVYILDDTGKIYSIALSKLKPTELSAKGNDIKSVANIKGVPVKSFITKPSNADIDEYSLIMFTETGIIKQSLLSKYITTRGELQGIVLNSGDRLCNVVITDPVSYYEEPYKLIYTEKGLGIALDTQTIPYTERLTKGSNFLKLEENDKVKGVCDTNTPYVFIVTVKGYCKFCELNDIFKTSNRRTTMIRLTGLNDDDSVFKIMPYDGNDKGKFTFILADGTRHEVAKADIPNTTRVSKGKKLIPVKKGNSIIRIRDSK